MARLAGERLMKAGAGKARVQTKTTERHQFPPPRLAKVATFQSAPLNSLFSAFHHLTQILRFM